MTSRVVEVASDSEDAWRFGRFFTPVCVIAFGLVGPLISYGGGGVSSFGTLLAAEVFAVAFGSILGYGYSLYSYLRHRTVRYEIEGNVLRAFRNDLAVRQIPVEAILEFRMRYVVDRRSVFTQFYPPSWPRGVVTYKDGEKLRRNELPPLLLWGRDAARCAEETIRDQVFHQPRQ